MATVDAQACGLAPPPWKFKSKKKVYHRKF